MQNKYVFLSTVLAVILIWLLSYLNQTDEQQQPVKLLKKEKPKNSGRESLATVERARKSGGYAIREPEKKKTSEVGKKKLVKKEILPIVLDEMKLQELKRQTEIAMELLSEIFIGEEEVHIPVNNLNSNAILEALQKLMEKNIWQREELQQLFGSNIMIGNMLEQINDYAYSKVGDVVVEEDGDTIYVTTEYKIQLI